MPHEAVSQPDIEGEVVRISTSDGRVLFGRWQDGGLNLNTKRNFTGRKAMMDGTELADLLFEMAKDQGRIDRRFGDAVEVRSAAAKPVTNSFRFGKKE